MTVSDHHRPSRARLSRPAPAKASPPRSTAPRRATHSARRAASAERGLFCGMGVCQDCLVEVDGKPEPARLHDQGRPAARRAPRGPCAAAGASRAGPAARHHRRHRGERARDARHRRRAGRPLGGDRRAAGRAPRSLSSTSARQPGGQYFKQLERRRRGAAAPDAPAPRRRRADRDGAAARRRRSSPTCTVWGAFEPLEYAATAGGRTLRLPPKAAIVATGAYERGWPVPGWTLPGVMTTGAAQTLWRTARRLPGKRVLIAGNGPLNLQLAAELIDGGAEVVAVVEAARRARPRQRRRDSPAWRWPRRACSAMACAIMPPGAAGGAAMLYGIGRRRASNKTRRRLSASTSRRPRRAARSRRFEVDVALPRLWLRALERTAARARLRRTISTPAPAAGDTPRCEAADRASPGVYALGDCTGLGGARAALAEGMLAGLAAADALGHALSASLEPRARSRPARIWQRTAASSRRCGRSTRRPPIRRRGWQHPDTLICRCEEVTFGADRGGARRGDAAIGSGEAAHARRHGALPGPLLRAGARSRLLAERFGRARDEFSGFAPRVPVKPVTIDDLARLAT